jgi:vacuolar-type H+-ATPase subunit I/STV1
VTEKTLALQLVEMADRVVELERQLASYKAINARQEAALGPRAKSIGTVFLDPAATIEKLESRNCELEAAIKRADAVVEQLTAERDAALERVEALLKADARIRELEARLSSESALVEAVREWAEAEVDAEDPNPEWAQAGRDVIAILAR